MKMADFIDWEVMLDESQVSRYAGSHIDELSKLFRDSRMIASNSSGSYQGDDCVVYLFTPIDPQFEPKIVIITSYFGSCSGCDAWEDIKDDDLRELLIAIVNNARLFDSFKEVHKFFDELIERLDSDEPYGEYYDLRDHVYTIQKQVKEFEIKLGNGSVA